MIPGVRCATCAFFSPPPFTPRGQVTYGQCRRHAPILDIAGDRPRSMWPNVPDSAWCGEHSTVEE